MSFYETYEFFALDRTLTVAEMRALRRISTRAVITPTRFWNFYDWGGLKGDPRAMLRRYFDLFVYTCSGGIRWGMLRLPATHVDARRWRPYVSEQRGTREPARCTSLATRNGQTILTLSPPEGDAADVFGYCSADHDAGELDEVSWGVSLAVLRSGLMAGDLRGLYLAWLRSVQAGERSVTAREPPRPEGLSDLTGVLYTFAEFLGLNAALMSVALTDDARGSRTVGELLDAARAHAAARRRRATSRPQPRAGNASRRSRS